MATNTCTTCGCKKCGCADNALTTPPPCPTPEGCPDPIPCSEYFDANCIVYTGLDIECLDNVVVETDTNLAEALDNIISFFCEYIAATTAGNIVEVCDTNDYLSISSTVDPVTGVTTYTVCFDPTNLPEVTLSGGTGINVTSNVVGNITTYTVTNTDLGSSQNIFKNFAVVGQPTVIADSNNDTLTFIAGAGIQLTTNNITDTITITNSASSFAVTLADAGTGAHESLVNDGTGPSLATKGLTAGTGVSLTGSATDVTITNSAPDQVVALTAGAGISTSGTYPNFTITNTDGGTGVSLTSAGGTETLVNDGTGPALATKGLTAGTGVSLTGSATAVTITNSAPDQVVSLTPGTGIGITGTYPNFTIDNTGTGSFRYTQVLPPLGVAPVAITHNLNTPFIIVSFHVNTSGLLLQGVDYTYNIVNNNTISVVPLSVAMQTFSVLITVLA